MRKQLWLCRRNHHQHFWLQHLRVQVRCKGIALSWIQLESLWQLLTLETFGHGGLSVHQQLAHGQLVAHWIRGLLLLHYCLYHLSSQHTIHGYGWDTGTTCTGSFWFNAGALSVCVPTRASGLTCWFSPLSRMGWSKQSSPFHHGCF